MERSVTILQGIINLKFSAYELYLMAVSLCLLDQTLVVVLTFVLASTDAPFDNKARTTFVCPRIAAVCKQMAPDWKYTKGSPK